MIIDIPATPQAAVVRRALGEFELLATDEQVLQIQRYMEILLLWNEKVNLTAIRDPLEILYRHFCESMYAAKVLTLQSGRLADVGSGGGFPGLPLKILRPDLHLFVVETDSRETGYSLDWRSRPPPDSRNPPLGVAGADRRTSFAATASPRG